MQLTPRQAEFADAALRLVAREGMGSVSFRAVAAESGMSLGAVQKAFATKDEMQGAMFQRMRATAAAPALGEPGRPTLLAWLTGLTLAILPLDAERRAAQLQAAAFADRAAFDPALSAVIAEGDHELMGNIARLIGRGIMEGEVDSGADPGATARAWLAYVQGLATQLLYDERELSAVEADVRYTLARLFGSGPGT